MTWEPSDPQPHSLLTMAPFETKYTAAQKQAIYDARFVKGLSYRRIVKAAADADLAGLEPFQISFEYVGELCRGEAKKRAGKVESALADKPHRDAVEVLRRRMISAADALTRHWAELAENHPEKADPERGRLITRLVREAAALPAPKDQAKTPGQTQPNGRKTEGTTRTGPAGSLLAAHRAVQRDHEPGTTPDHAETGAAEPTTQSDKPGSHSSERSTGLAA